ncbi:FAD binding domain-containing protein [Bradyrhizobium sp.]|jgi:carbon-monoxide dehydrogenase medium subunit|uniref:FAD binding domain-containing protein n=1 Tax=Bradyrhizobium sp. TaxID=376 RepID=UPI003C137D58
MKPSAFDIQRPNSVAEAIELLAASAGEASIVAGSQSLGPMLNLRLVRPRLLIDVTGISEMTKVEDDDQGVTIGACVTTASIEDGKLPCKGLTMLPAIAGNIAYRAVRNRGTIGGSVCHADPAADWPVTLCGLGASCIITGPRGRRSLPVDEFIVGAFENALDDDEILVAIWIPRLSPQGKWGYEKLCRKTGEFAMAAGAIRIDPERPIFRMAFGATEGRQIVIRDFRSLQRRNGVELDEAAVMELLTARGITDPVACRQLVTVMQRAYVRAMS